MLEIILSRYNFPYYKKKLNEFNAYAKKINEFCGDRIEVFLKIVDNKILEVGYDGKCCTISQGVLEILIDNILNKTVNEVKNLNVDYLRSIVGDEIIKIRTKCALFGLSAIKEALYEYERGA